MADRGTAADPPVDPVGDIEATPRRPVVEHPASVPAGLNVWLGALAEATFDPALMGECRAWQDALDAVVEHPAEAPSPEIADLLASLRLRHHVSPDCWYSCPLSDTEDPDEGCCDDERPHECDCGAEAHNARLDALTAALRSLTQEDR